MVFEFICTCACEVAVDNDVAADDTAGVNDDDEGGRIPLMTSGAPYFL